MIYLYKGVVSVPADVIVDFYRTNISECLCNEIVHDYRISKKWIWVVRVAKEMGVLHNNLKLE